MDSSSILIEYPCDHDDHLVLSLKPVSDLDGVFLLRGNVINRLLRRYGNDTQEGGESSSRMLQLSYFEAFRTHRQSS
jgi:hypothetical protein